MATKPADMRLMRFPDISGERIVYSYASDLWVTDRSAGTTLRLTSHQGGESKPKFSPDGQWIAFTGTYDGNADVFVMPAEGGEPKRLTYEGTQDIVLDWTPDGKIAYSSILGSITDRAERMWLIDPKGGMPISTPVLEVSDISYSPDGSKIAYNRNDSHNFNWRRYRGGTQGRIGFFDLKGITYSEIPSKSENSWQPMWVGNTVFYISDRDFGTRNLYCYDINSKAVKRLTEFKDADIKNPATDGKTIVFERDGYLNVYDIASGASKQLSISIVSDFPNARPRLRNVADSIGGVGLSPSGVRLAIDGRGDIFSVPAKRGDTRNLTSSPDSRETMPLWSPDAKWIAYLSDQGNEVRICMRPQMGGAEKILKTDPKDVIVSYDFSPDSKSIAYSTRDGKLVLVDIAAENSTVVAQSVWQSIPTWDWAPAGDWLAYVLPNDNLNGSIYLYNVAQKKSTKVTEGYYSDDSVTFDQSGKFLYFISGRTFQSNFGAFEIMLNMAPAQRIYVLPLANTTTNPMLWGSDEEKSEEPAAGAAAPPAAPAKPADEKKGTVIDLDGLADRALPLPFGNSQYFGILGVDNGVLIFQPGSITLFSLRSKSPVPVFEGAFMGASFNSNHSKIALRLPSGISVIDAAPGQNPDAGRVNTSNVELMWDPKAEWRQIFWESWRWQRDVFYDAKMLGLDWDAIGKHYATMLPSVNSRNDLNVVLANMIGELGTGHAYVGGGEVAEQARGIPVGHLGADFASEGKYLKFAKVYRGMQFEENRRGPLGEPGVNVKDGDFLLAIDGNEVTSSINPHMFLQNKAGKAVTLTINSKPSKDGARKVRVRPIANEAELRYISWVEGNRKKVADASGGRIGYIHVPDTQEAGITEFVKGFYSQQDKDAWLIDERFNGGGYIPTFFVEFLRREVSSKMKARNWKDIWFPTGTLEGPKAMLVNEYAGSGGDMLPWLFQTQKVGPLIGTRTWGGLVGIQGSAPLIDGGFLSAPGFGIYDPHKGEWIAENKGVTPDVVVDARPDLIAKGQDPQLETGIKYLMDELKKGKKPSKTPDFINPKPGK